MKFYDRTNELAELERIKQLSFNDSSRLTVVTGRRRIGKTSLILKCTENSPTVYLFVGRKNESTLCAEFAPIIAQSLDSFVPEGMTTFRALFQHLMELARQNPSIWLSMNFRSFTTSIRLYSAICKIYGTHTGRKPT